MSNLPGNPFEESAQDDPANMGGTTANAILALAYEQRTTSLIAAAQLAYSMEGPTADAIDGIKNIFKRLGLGDTK